MCIRDISTRGLCLVAAHPPIRGTIVEVIGGYRPMVGRVVWASERRFGVSIGGRIDVSAFLAQKSASPPGDATVALSPAPPSRADSGGRRDGRALGNGLQFLFLAFLAGAAALWLGQTVYEQLSSASAMITSGMAH